MGEGGGVAWHFSEEPGIAEFEPRTGAAGAPDEALVWAIDAEHAPSYWFPRDCPRVTFWRGAGEPTEAGAALLAGATAERVHAIEWGWLDRVRFTRLYGYAFAAAEFEPFDPHAGYVVARRPVRPVRTEPLGDPLARHAAAGIELRLVPTIWPLVDAVVGSGLEFSIIRKHHATPR